MRGVLLLLVLASCTTRGFDGPPGGISDPVRLCNADTDCTGGKVCARTGECYATSDVRAARVTWTLSGKAASQDSCSATPDLLLQFRTSRGGQEIGFEPVPCIEGLFSIDKLPLTYSRVELGVNASTGGMATIDNVTGQAAIDLPY